MMLNIFHDLRSPLFAVSSGLDTLEAAPEALPALLPALQQRTAFLRRLTEDLFLAAKLEQKQVMLNEDRVSLGDIFLHTVQYLQEEFEGCRYMAGFYEHDMVSAMWSIDESGLLSAYSRELSLLGKTTEDMIPMVRVTTSDTGTCGANIYPMLLNVKDGKSVNLGSPLKLVHKNGSTMADYDAQLKKLYAKYQLAIGKLTELLEVRIANPVNCMSEVMAKLAIPKKYQAEALDLFKAQYDVWSCTAHDIYFAISEILFMLECEGASGSRIAKMEEQIARALSMNWAEYDFPEM